MPPAKTSDFCSALTSNIRLSIRKVQRLRFLIVTPASKGSTKGNRITADRWAGILRKLGHHVTVSESFDGKSYDVLIALHARKSARSVTRFRKKHPRQPVLVAMTGTDLHIDLGRSRIVDQVLAIADHIILLEPEGRKLLKQRFRKKTHVIFQSATPRSRTPTQLKRCFEVAVIGHLRSVKDPFRAAAASRLLPGTSRIKIVHIGSALTKAMAHRARAESDANPRYQWVGPVLHSEAIRRLARSRLLVLSSQSEGAPAVISEAIVNGVPMLVTRIDATIGMLGSRYPGFFDYRDTDALARLLHRAETDRQFYIRLVAAGRKLKKRFSPETERANWKSFLKQIGASRTAND